MLKIKRTQSNKKSSSVELSRRMQNTGIIKHVKFDAFFIFIIKMIGRFLVFHVPGQILL